MWRLSRAEREHAFVSLDDAEERNAAVWELPDDRDRAAIRVRLREALTAFAALPERRRDIKALHIEGFSYEEIAEMRGLTRTRANHLLVEARTLPFLEPAVGNLRRVPHLSELHGASTHLAVVAIPVFAILHFVRRAGRGGSAVAGAEPWALAASVAGVALSGVTGLLVWGQAQTVLRGPDFRVGSVHFWLGIAIAVLSVGVSVDWYLSRRREGLWHRPLVVPVLAVLIVAGVAVQGYLGGRMTYHRAVGVFDGGELAQSAAGASALDAALAKGASQVTAGRQAFSERGLGCASCHGDLAQGERGPSLAGGRDVAEFRDVHGHGLFPPQIVSDRDFYAIDAWLATLPHPRGHFAEP